jgi:hypothetical protein
MLYIMLLYILRQVFNVQVVITPGIISQEAIFQPLTTVIFS